MLEENQLSSSRARDLKSTSSTTLETIEQVDNYIYYLTTFIQNLIQQTVPTARISKHSKPWWNEEVGTAIKEERRARRR
jgi:hypothetical protein